MDRDAVNRGNTLEFDQPAEFYLRRYERHRDKGDLPEAMQDLQRALQRSPDNADIIRDIAELYADMGYYDRSNETLLMHMYRPEMRIPEVYCLLGHNFLYSGDWDKARECLNICLNMDPDEDTFYTAEHMLDVLEEQIAVEEEEDEIPPQIHLVGEEFSQTAMNPDQLLFVAARQAQQGRIDDALHTLEQRSRIVGTDMQGLCARAMFCIRADRQEEGEKALTQAKNLYPESPQELILLSDTLGFFGRHREVLEKTDAMLDEGWGHYLLSHVNAVAHYNLGEYAQARRIWNRMLLVEPEDRSVGWCAQQATLALAGEPSYESMPYIMGIPKREIYLKARQLQRIFDAPVTAAELREDSEIVDTILWLLHADENCDHASLLHALYLIQGKKTEGLMRQMLVKSNVSDEDKEKILEYLHSMQAEGPFIALMETGVVEFSAQDIAGSGLTPDQERILEMFLHKTQGEDPTAIRYGKDLWHSLCVGNADMSRIRSVNGWAAALHYALMQSNIGLENKTREQIAEMYDLPVRRLDEYLKKLWEKTRNPH